MCHNRIYKLSPRKMVVQFALAVAPFFAVAADVSTDLNDEIDPHHNNGNLVISDEKKITTSVYNNYGVMTLTSTGILNVEKQFYNVAQYDEVNKTYLATLNIDGGKFIAYSLLLSYGDFRNYGFVNITNNGTYENGCTYYSEKSEIEYGDYKPKTLIDNSTFKNLSGATYKNLSDSDTYIQNSALFQNQGTVLNDNCSYFKLDSLSRLENSGSFQNENTLKIVNSTFSNTGTFLNSDSVEINSGTFDNNGASALANLSSGTVIVKGAGKILNQNSANFSVSGGNIDMSEYGNFINSSLAEFKGSASLTAHDESPDATSSSQLSLQNSGTMNFSDNASLSISDGNHLNSGKMNFSGKSTFSIANSFFTNGQNLTLSGESVLSMSSGNLTNGYYMKIGASARVESSGGFIDNFGIFVNDGSASFSDGKFRNEEATLTNNGTFSLSGTAIFDNLQNAVLTNNGNFVMTGGTFQNSAELNCASSSILEMRGGVFENRADANFSGSLRLLGGSFIQSSTASFVNSTGTTIDGEFRFYADRTNLVGAINNTSGSITLGENAAFKVRLDESFRNDSIKNLEIMLIFGSGELNDEYGVVLSSVSLEWENGESADSDFDWNVVSGDGNLKVVLNSFIPEPAEWAAVLGILALYFAARHRRKSSFATPLLSGLLAVFVLISARRRRK